MTPANPISAKAPAPTASETSMTEIGAARRRNEYSAARYTSSSAVASTTPPWKPPPGVRWPWATMYRPVTTVGPISPIASPRTASLVRGALRPKANSCGSRSSSSRWARRMMATPTTAAKRMNSSPSVSKPR